MVRAKWVILSLAVLAALALVGTYGYAKDGAKAKVELTEAAANAVAAAFPGAKIEKVKAEDEDGVAVFEVELKLDKQEIEITVAPSGTIIEIETDIHMKDVPEAAAKVILSAAEGGKIEEVKKVDARAEIKDNKIVQLNALKITYEAEIEKGDQEGEIAVAANGDVVKPLKLKAKEKEEEKDEKGGCEKK
ncbi:MAG: hypothetical protein NT049_12730 [Planctomycetota bacterium]|nr:hypothetical protein [Planctomycetota bacterium]